jgi:hypothetical protein
MGNVSKKVKTFSCYDNVDELVGPYVGCLRHINGLCMFFLQENCHLNPKLMWKGTNISIGKRQDHNTKKPLSISKAQYDGRSDSGIPRNMEVLSTYVTWVHSQLGYQKGVSNEKRLQRITLDFCLSYIILIVMDCCMPIDKMMFF